METVTIKSPIMGYRATKFEVHNPSFSWVDKHAGEILGTLDLVYTVKGSVLTAQDRVFSKNRVYFIRETHWECFHFAATRL